MANAVYDPEKEDQKEQSFGAPDDGAHDDLGVHPERKEAEIADLENAYAEGTAQEPSYAKQSSPSAESLQSAEESGSGKTKEKDSDDIPYADDDKPSGRQRFRAAITKKRVIAGGAVGLLVGGSFGFLTIVSGPLQFIHFAQLLQQFHFSSHEDAGDDRMSKIGRYLRYRNDTKRTRLNYLGNAYADKIEAKLNKSGVESAYTEKYQYFDGYVIDPLQIPEGSDLHDLQNKTPEDLVGELAKRYDIDPGKIDLNLEEGKVAIHADDLGYFKSKKLIKNIMEDVGFSKVEAALQARIMGRRAGIDWHPMKKLDRTILEKVDARYKKWREERQQRIDEGEDSITTHANETDDTDGDGKADAVGQEGAEALAETDDVLAEGRAAGKEIASGTTAADGAFAKLHASTSFKLAGGVTAAIGILCTIKGLADNVDQVKHLNVVLPLMRMGMEMVTVGNQVMSGKDVDLEQLGFYAKQLNNKDTGSWANARSVQAEQNQKLTGPDIRDEAKVSTEGNLVSEIAGSIPGLDGVCAAANSVVGQVVSFGIDILGGPISAISGQVVGTLVAPHVVDGIVGWLAGHPISINVSGADYGNYVNYGARLAANDTKISAGGRELTPVESAQLRDYRMQSQKDEESTKSFAERMFDPYNANSLVSRVIDKQNPDVGANVASALRSFTDVRGMFSSIASSFSSIFAGKAQAAVASNYDYGFPEYGFSVSELNSAAVENPFENGQRAIALLTGKDGKMYRDKASKCFGMTLGTDGTVKSGASVPAYYQIPDDCKDNSTDWLRIRMYIFDTEIMQSAACVEGDEQSCKDSGFGPAAPSGSQATNANVYFLGDSLTVGMRDGGSLVDKAQNAGWKPTVMAECGRHLVSDAPNCSGQQVFGGLNQVDQPADQAAIKEAGVVVVGLGTNDPGSSTFADDVRNLVNKITTLNPSTKVYWVNLFSTDDKAGTYQAMDDTLKSVAASSGFTVIDWATQAQQTNAYSPGTYHPNDYPGMADFVISQIGKAP